MNSRSSTSLMSQAPDATYNIRVTLTDHTGTVSRCIVAAPVADKMLGITVQYDSHFIPIILRIE